MLIFNVVKWQGLREKSSCHTSASMCSLGVINNLPLTLSDAVTHRSVSLYITRSVEIKKFNLTVRKLRQRFCNGNCVQFNATAGKLSVWILIVTKFKANSVPECQMLYILYKLLEFGQLQDNRRFFVKRKENRCSTSCRFDFTQHQVSIISYTHLICSSSMLYYLFYSRIHL